MIQLQVKKREDKRGSIEVLSDEKITVSPKHQRYITEGEGERVPDQETLFSEVENELK